MKKSIIGLCLALRSISTDTPNRKLECIPLKLKRFLALQREKPTGAFMSSSQKNFRLWGGLLKKSHLQPKRWFRHFNFPFMFSNKQTCIENVFLRPVREDKKCVKGQLILEFSAPYSGLPWMVWWVGPVQILDI